MYTVILVIKAIILPSSCLADEWHTYRKAGLEFGEQTKGDKVRNSTDVTKDSFLSTGTTSKGVESHWSV